MKQKKAKKSKNRKIHIEVCVPPIIPAPPGMKTKLAETTLETTIFPRGEVERKIRTVALFVPVTSRKK